MLRLTRAHGLLHFGAYFALIVLMAPAHAGTATFAIDPQDLPGALKAFAVQSHREIFFAPELARGRQSKGVKGKLDDLKALNIILEGTGLNYSVTPSDAILVRDPADKSTSEPSPAVPGNADSSKEAGKNSSQDFRVAQEGHGKGSGASSLVNQATQINSIDTSTGLSEIVVTAQKREERLKDVPISISVTSGATLEKSSLVSVAEALNQVPGVVVLESPQSGGNMVAIRGVTASGPLFDGSSPIGYYLDSVPFGFVTLSMAPDQSAFDLQRVEVLRGPQGTLYGASAEGGLVRVLTNDADLNNFDLAGRATLSSTDHGAGENYRGDMMINAPIVDGVLAARAVVGYEDLSGWIDRPAANELHSNDAALRNARLKINAQPVEGLAIGLSAWTVRDSYGAPSTSLADRTAPGTGTAAEPRTWDYDAYAAKVSYEFPLVSLSSQTSYLTLTNDYQGDLTPFGLPGAVVHGKNGGTVTSEEVTATSTGTGSWRWTAGSFYRDAKEQYHEAIPGFTSTFFDGSNRSKSEALYGELGQRLFDNQWEWTLGLRYFHDDVDSTQLKLTGQPYAPQSATFNSTTPRAVLTWHATRNLIVYESFSEGFRSGFPEQPAFPQLPAVKPDKLYDYEVGAKGDLLDARLSFDAAVYYYDWRDVQETLPVAYNFTYVQLPTNGPSASGPGFEVSLTARPITAFELGGSFSWNDLTYDSNRYAGTILQFSKGDRLNYSAKYTASAFSDYSFPVAVALTGKFSAAAVYTSRTEARFPNVSGPPAFSFGNDLSFVRLSFAINDTAEHWSGMLFLDNATNEYGAYAANQPIPDYTPRPRPRTVGLQINYRLK